MRANHYHKEDDHYCFMDNDTFEQIHINEDAMGDGWFVKLRLSDPAELDKLMDEAAYNEFVESLQ